MNQARTKVLYIITKSVWGGAQKYVFDLASHLPRERFKPIVAAGGEGELARKLRRAEVPYHHVTHLDRAVRLFDDIRALIILIRLISKTRPDVIHVSSSKAGLLVGVATIFYKAKKIFTAHGWVFNEDVPHIKKIMYIWLSKLTARLYNTIICVSEYDKQTALKYDIAPERKLITIHNGIKPEDYDFYARDEARERLGLEQNATIVGTIGEFTKNKGHRYLIEAMRKVQISKSKAVIIGFGENKPEGNVHLIENLHDAARYLKAFDVFALPSVKEGLPYTLLEARLAGVPIVATRVGGIPEIVPEECLVPPKDTEVLATAIKKALVDPRQPAPLETDFLLSTMLASTLRVYE